MVEIDYKHVAKNILKLLDVGADKGIVDCYAKWITGAWLWRTRYKYELLCEAMKLLGLPEPTIDEWKNR